MDRLTDYELNEIVSRLANLHPRAGFEALEPTFNKARYDLKLLLNKAHEQGCIEPIKSYDLLTAAIVRQMCDERIDELMIKYKRGTK